MAGPDKAALTAAFEALADGGSVGMPLTEIWTQVMRAEWIFLPQAVAATGAVAAVLTLGLGFAGTWRALGQKAAPVLREL